MLSKVLSVLTCTLFVVLGCISCKAVWNRKSQFSQQDITQEKLQQFEKLMHLSFPASTRALNAAAETGGPDDAVFLKVEMDKQDLETFVKNSPFANADLRNDQKQINNQKDLTWWNPDAARTYRSGQVMLPSSEYLNILIDFDHDKKIVVYLMWFET
jgi:hypothetical protein